MVGTTQMLEQLRGEGYQVSPGYLQYLLREGLLTAPQKVFCGIYVWGPSDVSRLQSLLRRRGRGPEKAEAPGRRVPFGVASGAEAKP